jgi:DNA-binding CsgD family transcriptional regulator
MLGREAEQAAIRSLIDGGGALIFRGDVGSGKTALLAWAARSAAECTVVELSADRTESALPFAALHRLLESLPAAEPPLPGAEDRLALCARVRDLLADAAPLLVCVDDVHWLDRPTWDVLTFAARRLGGQRIALLFAGRDGDADRPAGIETRDLGPLDDNAGRELIRDLVPDASVAAAVTAAGGGNPQALLDLAGALSPEQRRGEASAMPALPAGSRVRREYRDRLGRLPAGTRRLMLLAAIDPELTADELVRAAGASGIDIAALGPAETAGLIGIDASAVRFPCPVVRCVVHSEATLAERRSAHALLARTLDPHTRPLRHLMHRAAAACAPDEALADRLERAADAYAAGDHPAASRALERAAELSGGRRAAALRLIAAARHAWRAGDPHRARTLLRRARPAATVAYVRARWELIIGEIELRTGDTTPGGERLLAAAESAGEHDRRLAVDALARAGDALALAGDHARFAELAERAAALRRPDDPIEAEFVFEHFAGLAATFRGEHGRAVPPLRRAVTLAGTLGGTSTLIRASMAALVLGDAAGAYGLAVRAAGLARDRGDVPAIPQALESAAMADLVTGRLDDTTGVQGLHLARQSGQHGLAGSQLATLGLLAATIGDRETTLSRLRDIRSLPAAGRAGRARAMSAWALAVLDVAAGEHREAVRRLAGITRPAPRRGHLLIRVAATPLFVEAAVNCGEDAAARRSLATFDAWASSTGSAHWLALSARCHALLARDEADAHDHFREALSLHDLIPVEFDRARTQLQFGQWLRRRRRPATAREPLRGALETFERFDARPWADQARAELRAAGEQPAAPARSLATDALTPHQLQIARLVAEGATNREVAQRMAVSTRTIDHHMRNILTALGVRSRVELANLLR